LSLVSDSKVANQFAAELTRHVTSLVMYMLFSRLSPDGQNHSEMIVIVRLSGVQSYCLAQQVLRRVEFSSFKSRSTLPVKMQCLFGHAVRTRIFQSRLFFRRQDRRRADQRSGDRSWSDGCLASGALRLSALDVHPVAILGCDGHFDFRNWNRSARRRHIRLA